MFNKEFMKERKQMIAQQLVYDRICCLKIEVKTLSKLQVEELRELNEIYDELENRDVIEINNKSKAVLINLIKKRIIEMDKFVCDEEDSLQQKLKTFLVNEYKLLLKELDESTKNQKGLMSRKKVATN